MATDEKMHISLFDVVGNSDDEAVYGNRFYFDSDLGAHAEALQDIADGRKRPEDFAIGQGPQSTLDIEETRTDGLCVYAFQLSAFDTKNRHRLMFVDPPFIQLPANSSTKEDFWVESRLFEGWTRRWASFTLDLGAIRSSSLANRIKSDPEREQTLEHTDHLTIPFCFNVVDPVLEAAPWTVPFRKPRIHGGVHPKSVVFIDVPI